MWLTTCGRLLAALRLLPSDFEISMTTATLSAVLMIQGSSGRKPYWTPCWTLQSLLKASCCSSRQEPWTSAFPICSLASLKNCRYVRALTNTRKHTHTPFSRKWSGPATLSCKCDNEDIVFIVFIHNIISYYVICNLKCKFRITLHHHLHQHVKL